VFNHNLETVPSLYRRSALARATITHCVCSSAPRSLRPASSPSPASWSVSARPKAEVLALMDDLRALTSTSSPSANTPADPQACRHRPLVTPEEFDDLRAEGEARGFLLVAASPLTGSSYTRQRISARLRAARQAALGR